MTGQVKTCRYAFHSYQTGHFGGFPTRLWRDREGVEPKYGIGASRGGGVPFGVPYAPIALPLDPNEVEAGRGVVVSPGQPRGNRHRSALRVCVSSCHTPSHTWGGGFLLTPLSPNPPKDTDGRREDSGRVGEGATGEMAGLIGVDWRSANGLQSPHRAPMCQTPRGMYQ